MSDSETARHELAVGVLRDLQTALDELVSEDFERWDRAVSMLEDFQNLLVFMHDERLDNRLFTIVDELADEVEAKTKRVRITGAESFERE